VRFISFFVDDFLIMVILIESISKRFSEVFSIASLSNPLLFKTMSVFTLSKSASLCYMGKIAEMDFDTNFHPSSDVI